MPTDELPFPDCQPWLIQERTKDDQPLSEKGIHRQKGQAPKGMETAKRKNRPALCRHHAEGFRELLGRLVVLPGPRSDAETKAISYLTACAEYLEQDETVARLTEKHKAVQERKLLAGVNVGAGRGRPKKQND